MIGPLATTSTVIPGRALWRAPGIHQAAGADGEMDSGFVLRTPRNDGGEKFASDFNLIWSVHSSQKKHSASVVGQISTMTPRVSPE